MTTKYYDKKTHTEVDKKSEHTIAQGEGIIDWWFEGYDINKKIYYINDIPYYSYDYIHEPKLVDGKIVESISKEKLRKMEALEAFEEAKRKELAKEIEEFAKNY